MIRRICRTVRVRVGVLEQNGSALLASPVHQLPALFRVRDQRLDRLDANIVGDLPPVYGGVVQWIVHVRFVLVLLRTTG